MAIGAVKFLVTPAIGLSLAWIAGFWAMEDRTLLQVVFIQSTTPTAIMGLILAQLFDLDEQLANAAWLITNVAAVALAPVVLAIAAGL
jgi:predicted permease